MTTIRPFSNSDLPVLLELWIQHWSAIGPPPHVSRARLEQAVLSRTFFDPATLLLAETNQHVHSWCHYAPCRTDETTAVICALCLDRSRDLSVHQALLSAAEQRIGQSRFGSIQAGLVRDQDQGYAGLEPIGHGFGIPSADQRTTQLLQQAGFSQDRRAVQMMVSADAYRPPVSREALQLRRSSRISSDPEVIIDRDAHRASSQSHLDIEHYRLLDRSGQQLSSLLMWFSDPEAEVMSPSKAILDISQAHERGRLEAAERYLIASLVQSLAERSISTVETVVDTDKTELIAQLEKLQFYREAQGATWKKTL